MKQPMCTRCGERPAIVFIQKMEDGVMKPEGLCYKCAKELNVDMGPIQGLMEKMGISEDELEQASEQMGMFMENMDDFDFGDLGAMFNPENSDGAQTMPFAEMMSSLTGEEPSGNSSSKQKGRKNHKKSQDESRKFLNNYCNNLTAKAKKGEIDNIIGRESEIERAVQILCRRTKNNPCLIGEPGVGKTAIAEGLAIKIAKGEVPARLMDKEIYLLDLTALVAGTQFRGQFEGRIKGLVDEVKHEGNIILFIDEVHNLVGTGDSEGTMNAANILKPALSRGEIQVIGATTFNEYRKYIEKDAALERRFQPIKVEEPSIDDAYRMLLGIKGYYEDYHKVKINDSLLYKAVTMSERFVTDRYLPDKAIDLLDESCTCANLRNPAISRYQMLLEKKNNLMDNIDKLSEPEEGEQIDYELISKLKSQLINIDNEIPEVEEKAKDNQVLEADLAKVISLWTGIPASKVEQGDINKLASLDNELKAHIIGQDEAIEKVANAVRRGRIQISPKKRPQSFIFVGPTGVGKTELVKVLSDELFKQPESLIRLDMSEFMEKHAVSRIIGAPPGYVGYDEAGQLTEKIRRRPYAVILFDEIEKAHPDVMNILLQILDDGKITDAQGRTVNFENTVIIMTTNAGSERSSAVSGFTSSGERVTKDRTERALADFLRPEFLNRIDEIITFRHLGENDMSRIAGLMLKRLADHLTERGIALKYTPEVPDFIAHEAYSEKYGARNMRRYIERNVEDGIATVLIEKSTTAISGIGLSVADGKIKINAI